MKTTVDKIGHFLFVFLISSASVSVSQNAQQQLFSSRIHHICAKAPIEAQLSPFRLERV